MYMKKVFSLALALVILLMPITGCNNKKSVNADNSQIISYEPSEADAINKVATEVKASGEAEKDRIAANNQDNNKSDTDNKQGAENSKVDNDGSNNNDNSSKVTAAPTASAKPNQAEATPKPQATVTPTEPKPQAATTPTEQKPQVTVAQITEQTQPSNESKMISEVLRLVNEQRTANGLSKLTYRSDLQKAADIRAEEIINTFSHTRPDGSECFTVFTQIGVTDYRRLGENIAKGYETPESVMDGWMNSEGHRANILNSDFEGIIIGIKEVNSDGYIGYAWVQLFITQ